MSETASYVLALLIVIAVSFSLGYFFYQYWYIPLPASMAFGYFGGPVIQKRLLSLGK